MEWTRKSISPHSSSKTREDLIDSRDVFDVARQHERRAHLLGERRHAFAERFALIGEGERRAVFGEFLGDAISDGMVVGDAHDEPALTLHQTF